MNESQNCYVKWNKADTKDSIMDYSIYMTFLKSKTVEIKIRSVVARGWNGVSQGLTTKVYKGGFMVWWSDGDFTICWLWWWLYNSTHLPLLRELSTEKVWILLYVNYTSRNLMFRKKLIYIIMQIIVIKKIIIVGERRERVIKEHV